MNRLAFKNFLFKITHKCAHAHIYTQTQTNCNHHMQIFFYFFLPSPPEILLVVKLLKFLFTCHRPPELLAKGIASRPQWVHMNLLAGSLPWAPETTLVEHTWLGCGEADFLRGHWMAALNLLPPPFQPPGDDDGPPSEDYFLHRRHREHCRADGPQADATLQLPGERGSLAPVPGWKKAIQDDLPRL